MILILLNKGKIIRTWIIEYYFRILILSIFAKSDILGIGKRLADFCLVIDRVRIPLAKSKERDTRVAVKYLLPRIV